MPFGYGPQLFVFGSPIMISNINNQIQPITGINIKKIFQLDFPKSCIRLAKTAKDGKKIRKKNTYKTV